MTPIDTLSFNLNDKAYKQGRESFYQGIVVNRIPYKETMAWKEFQRGWDRSYFENLEKVKERENESRSTDIPAYRKRPDDPG